MSGSSIKIFYLAAIVVILGMTYLEFFDADFSYAENYDRDCKERADPVRVDVGGLVFKLPADVFDRSSLSRCLDEGTWGIARYCTTRHQNQKEFSDGMRGFCQNWYDFPFSVGFTKLNLFAKESEYVSLVKVSLGEGEERILKVLNVMLSDAKWHVIENYCRDPSGYHETLKMFGNPVKINCKSDSDTCYVSTLIGSSVLFQSIHKKKEFPKEVWPAYVAYMEKSIKSFLGRDMEAVYPSICRGYQD